MNSTALEQVVSEIDQALAPHPPAGFRWMGMDHDPYPASLLDGLPPGAQRALLRQALSRHLYTHAYAYGRPVRRITDLPSSDYRLDLRKEVAKVANLGFREDVRWHAESAGTSVVASRDGVRVQFGPDRLQSTAEGPRIVVPQADPAVSPGFFLVHGRHGSLDSEELYRFYFALAPPYRAHAMGTMIQRLDERRIPFQMKAASQSGLPTRADACVLYVGADDLLEVHRMVEAAVSDWQAWLHPAPPLFTKQLAPGVGFAQDPGTGQSFGESRCSLLAEAWLESTDREKPVQSLWESFLATVDPAGLSHDRVHLASDGSDVPAFRESVAVAQTGTAPGAARTGGEKAGRDVLVRTAIKVGDWLVDHAFTAGDRATWIAVRPGESHGSGGPSASGTLSADLYGGLAGISLFLARLYGVTGQGRFQELAAMSARQALARRQPPEAGSGLYTGHLGVLDAVAEVSALIGDDDLLKVVEGPLDTMDRESDNPSDLLHGLAGEIVALLRLAKHTSRPSYTDAAYERGLALVDRATPFGPGVGWPVNLDGTARVLAGFSHGGSGIAHALSRLHAHHPQTAFLELAHGALRGEDELFDEQTGSWLDLRSDAGGQATPNYWCHGAPGILLGTASVLGTGSSDSDEEWLRKRALTAFRATERFLDRAQLLAFEDLSLCHGVCGNIEIADLAIQHLGFSMRRSPEALLASVVSGLGNDPTEWPHGLKGGVNPSVMTGFTGVGLACLRMATGTRTSVLLP